MIVKVDDPRLSPEEQARAAELAQRRVDMRMRIFPDVALPEIAKIVARAIDETILSRDVVARAQAATSSASDNLCDAARDYTSIHILASRGVANASESDARHALERAAIVYAETLDHERKVSS